MIIISCFKRCLTLSDCFWVMVVFWTAPVNTFNCKRVLVYKSLTSLGPCLLDVISLSYFLVIDYFEVMRINILLLLLLQLNQKQINNSSPHSTAVKSVLSSKTADIPINANLDSTSVTTANRPTHPLGQASSQLVDSRPNDTQVKVLQRRKFGWYWDRTLRLK